MSKIKIRILLDSIVFHVVKVDSAVGHLLSVVGDDIGVHLHFNVDHLAVDVPLGHPHETEREEL